MIRGGDGCTRPGARARPSDRRHRYAPRLPVGGHRVLHQRRFAVSSRIARGPGRLRRRVARHVACRKCTPIVDGRSPHRRSTCAVAAVDLSLVGRHGLRRPGRAFHDRAVVVRHRETRVFPARARRCRRVPLRPRAADAHGRSLPSSSRPLRSISSPWLPFPSRTSMCGSGRRPAFRRSCGVSIRIPWMSSI